MGLFASSRAALDSCVNFGINPPAIVGTYSLMVDLYQLAGIYLKECVGYAVPGQCSFDLGRGGSASLHFQDETDKMKRSVCQN